MCGILFTDKQIVDLAYIIEYLKNRGPDGTSFKKMYGFTFVHTLLSMTGDIMPQPFIDNQIIAMFNGEIYNYKDFETDELKFTSDGQCIIPLYREHGESFISKLDGEFALILCDFVKNIIIVSTDIFSTKPLWIAIDEVIDSITKEKKRHIGISSYRSCLDRLEFKNIVQMSANTTFFINIDDRKIINENVVKTFDLNQHKDTYDDLINAITESIQKRVRCLKHGLFIGLSSGYDSGSISCILNNLEIHYTAYSIMGLDDTNLIKERHMLLNESMNSEMIDLEHSKFLEQRDYLIDHCDEYYLTIDNGENGRFENLLNEIKHNPKKNIMSTQTERLFSTVNSRLNGQLLTNDNGAIGVSHICRLARENGRLVYLSGSGADEIFSDYGFKGIKFYGHSTIGGHFPDKLETVFPWKNFFDNTQRAYLMKEEYVTGAYGIEGRYPFLDRDVVQEFLWLKPELKNNNYKSPLHYLMEKYGYPFNPNEKIGFNCGFQGPENNYMKRDRDTTNRDVKNIARPDLVVDFKQVHGGHRHSIICLPREKIVHHKGYCYSCPIKTINDLGLMSGHKSKYRMFENNREIPLLGNTPVEMIIAVGRGRYCIETSNRVYFSAIDNSDPRNNGRFYRLKL